MAVYERWKAPERIIVAMRESGVADHVTRPPARLDNEIEYVRADLHQGAVDRYEELRGWVTEALNTYPGAPSDEARRMLLHALRTTDGGGKAVAPDSAQSDTHYEAAVRLQNRVFELVRERDRYRETLDDMTEYVRLGMTWIEDSDRHAKMKRAWERGRAVLDQQRLSEEDQ